MLRRMRSLRSVLPLALVAALATAVAAAGPRQWAAGDASLPELDAYVEGVRTAVGKTLPRAPASKPGAEVRLLVTASDGGSRAAIEESTLDPKLMPEMETWASKWILPVGEPGMAVPVRVWWEKPPKGYKKEKVPKGGTRTRPPPGLQFDVGWAPETHESPAAGEVLKAGRLVFTSGDACPDELADLRAGTWAVTRWHLDVGPDGAVEATPQDLYVPPPDPNTREGRRALAEMEAAEAPAVEAPEGAPAVEAPAAPEAPKFEFPGGVKAPEKPAKEEEEEAEPEPPPREWTPLEQCLAARLAEARPRLPADGGATGVDDFPVLVRQP